MVGKMKKVRYFLSVLLAVVGILHTQAQIQEKGLTPQNDTLSIAQLMTRTASEEVTPLTHTVKSSKHFLPTRRRIDREINKNSFIYKGEVMLGLTASYGTLSSEDSDFLLLLEHMDAGGTIASVKPFFGYAYHDNHVLGARFGYTYIHGTIDNLGFNLGAQNDLSGSLSNMGYKSDNFTFSLFHRSYVGLDPKGRFGLFAEFEGSVMVGTSRFDYMAGELPKGSNSNNFQAKLSFNPGMAVYVFPNVCATVSFGLGGIQYSKVTQKNEAGEQVGSRVASKMRFRLNLADINIGMTIHLWDKKKK